MTDPSTLFASRDDRKAVEQGTALAPKFDRDGLIPCVATDHESGVVLMVAYMNAEALAKTIELGEAVYFSRSRQELWHKGQTSGNVQKVRELRVDCDQDCVWIRVEQVGGAACHTGYKSCFYRKFPVGADFGGGASLELDGGEKMFDPEKVYGKK